MRNTVVAVTLLCSTILLPKVSPLTHAKGYNWGALVRFDYEQ